MKKVIIGCLGAVAAMVVIAVLAIWFWLFRESPTLAASISTPAEVEIGSTVPPDHHGDQQLRQACDPGQC